MNTEFWGGGNILKNMHLEDGKESEKITTHNRLLYFKKINCESGNWIEPAQNLA
jgi:hypothetical protein